MLVSNSPHQVSQEDYRDIVFKLRQALFETRDRIAVEFRCVNPEHQTGARACGGIHRMTLPFPAIPQVLERSLADGGWVVGPPKNDVTFEAVPAFPPRHVPDIFPKDATESEPTNAPTIIYHTPIYTEDNSRQAVEDYRRFGETNNLGEEDDNDTGPEIEDPADSPFDGDTDDSHDDNEDPFGAS